MGNQVDPFATAALYAPLQAKVPTTGVKVLRDVQYGPGEQEKFDVFTPSNATTGAARPILIFVHGGAFRFDDKSQTPDGQLGPFYDNVMIWAVKYGMVGINMNYTLAPRATYPAVQREIAEVVAWARAHDAQIGGDPRRIVIWGHSAGASHVASFLAHPDVYKDVVGATKPVMGAILSSGMYTLQDSSVNVYFGPPAIAQALNSVPGLVASTVPLLVTGAQFDPAAMHDEALGLDAALTKAGRHHELAIAKQHGHMSEIYAVGTDDEAVSAPMLQFIDALSRQ